MPDVRRFPEAAHADDAFDEATTGRVELIMVHVRRATVGGLKLENTHPFTEGPYSYCHNGTILKAALLEPLADRAPAGDTDSERFFNLLMARLRPGRRDRLAAPHGRGGRASAAGSRRSTSSSATAAGCMRYRFGVYELFWLVRSPDLDADTKTHYHLHIDVPTASTSYWSRARSSPTTSPGPRSGRTSCWSAIRPTPTTPASSACSASAPTSVEFEPARRGHADRRRARRMGRRRAAEGF